MRGTTTRRALCIAGLALAGTALAQPQPGQVNVICSVQADWCNMIQTVFAKSTGIKVNMSLKGSGEALAQLIAEKANPKTDVWFGGTGDPHLQAAESDLTIEYRSPTLAQQLGAAMRQYQLPSNKATPVDPNVPDFKKIKLIDYDYAKYGASAERRRLIAKWEKDVNSLPR